MSEQTQPYETLIVEKRGRIGWLIFNRPEVLNAFNMKMGAELSRAWRQLEEDDGVSVIVTTGAGRAFQTGADMRETADAGGMEGRVSTMAEEDRPKGGMTARTNDVWKPVIAAVNGACAGAGLHFIVDADMVVASTAAFFTDTHTTVGQVSALEPIGLIGRIPFESIMRLVLMGRHERFSPQRALEIGLIGQILDAEGFEDAVQEVAEKVASNSPTTMMASKKAIWNTLECGRAEALEYGMQMVKELWDHPDNVEGPTAFAQRRPADWAPPRRPRI